jgi:F-type H+-transporting ATPase subunit gamma
MQMIAAVKMRKAVQSAVNTRSYASIARDLMENLESVSDLQHPFVQKREVKKILLIIITSNRGLCGNYNSAVLRKAYKLITTNDYEYDVLAIGKKAANFAKRNGLNIIGIYDRMSENPNYTDVLPIAQTSMDTYADKTYDDVSILYTNYISGLIQEVKLRQLLPISHEEILKMIDELGAEGHIQETEKEIKESKSDFESTYYEFEPNKGELLKYILPMFIEIQIFQAILESTASEHSSRMIAMKNATDSAGEMIDELTLEFNKGRQAAITQEVAEINAGANALS